MVEVVKASVNHKDRYGSTNYGDKHAADQKLLKEAEKEGDVELAKFKYDESDERHVWFSLHDRDEDRHLDGHELYHAFSDADEPYTEIELTDWVDYVLDSDDKDGDGKISWAEYESSQTI